MSEQRKMIYVDDLRLSWLNKTTLIAYDPVDVLRSIDAQPTIDPETLPIVQELRAKLAHYEKAEREKKLVKVVRCKDCRKCVKHRTKRYKNMMYFCSRIGGKIDGSYQVNPNAFCAFGEAETELKEE